MFPTARRPSQKLLIFARLPELGRVKTRIAAEVGHDKALELYRAMVEDLLESVGESDETTEVEVLWTASSDASGEQVRACFGSGRHLAQQVGTSLGDRLCVAFSERFIFHNASKIIAIGTDDPSLSRHQISIAFGLLDSCEWVIGPASDGGYYLLGCRSEVFFPEIFLDVDWGTEKVFQQTTDRIQERMQTLALLPTRRDLDFVEDLRDYAGRNHQGKLKALLDQWGWKQ